ncbi:MAG: N-acetylmuramoyl-L-alanine amidase [Muribaculaceae bacterium]|nr:N-acetylmuramoyl-L-alanine amidase [Muribaculaceae bacterium]
MKKQIASLAISAMACVMAAHAVNPKDLTIYINPGHGGHDSNDRNVVIYPYTQGDPEGFWESNSNLDKGLMLRDMLQAKGIKVHMSRVTNTTADDLGLSTIDALANKTKADFFFSIHSNATGTSSRVNFPLMLYRGYDNQPVRPNNQKMAEILGKHLVENDATVWTNSLSVRGDWSFYHSWGDKVGLGVLRTLTIDGMLSEGSFHDYIPETYRLMNREFKWLEAWHFRKAVDELYGLAGDTKGVIVGRINDSRLKRDVNYVTFKDDKLVALHKTTVELYDETGTKKLADYTTDELYNGIYAFTNLEPGTYVVKAYDPEHYAKEVKVEVAADKATYTNIQLDKVRNTAPEVLAYSPVWKEGDEYVLCNSPVVFNFNWDMDEATTEKAFSITPAVNGKFVWSDANFTMSFVPEEPYKTDTEYTVVLDGSAQHAGGMMMGKDFTFKFHTSDRDFMQLLGHYPKNGDEVHYKGAFIEIRLDKHPFVSPILKQLLVKDANGNSVSLNTRSMKYSKAGDAFGFVRIPFTKALKIGEKYYVTISKEISDKDGITLQNTTEVEFTAVDASTEKPDHSLIDDFENVGAYTLLADDNVKVKSASIAADSKEKLFGNTAASITYTFDAGNDVNGEVLFGREAAGETVTESSSVIAHVYGDLTGNELYAQFTSETSVAYALICRLDFLGWENVKVDLSTLEGGSDYKLTGIKIVEVPTAMSKSGTVRLDNMMVATDDSGVESIEVATISIHPNPASEYLIANGDGTIGSIELIAMNGATVARCTGNVLNVSAIAEGTYIAKVSLASGKAAAIKKVIIKH